MYIEHLLQTKLLSTYLRIDRGTETGKMATIHAYLVNKIGIIDDATDSIIYSPSTSNKIEHAWRDLHERLERYFKAQLRELLERPEYDPNCNHDRQLIAYVYIPIVQRECNTFVDYWNSHRICVQEKLEIPTDIPNHMFSFPKNYGATNKGICLSEEDIREVADVAGVMDNCNLYACIEEVTRQFRIGT